jgi:MAF protein
MLVLASASPRRRELLAQAGFVFEVRPAHVNEDVRAGEDPIAYVTRLAREKAEAVFAELAGARGDSGSHPSDKNKDVARVGHTGDAGSHPGDKNKDVARVGHPGDSDSHPGDKDRDVTRVGHPGDAGPSTAVAVATSAQDDRVVEAQDDSVVEAQDERFVEAAHLAVLGADTTVTLDGEILGKPVDAEDAARMLRMLSGRTHRVITGVALVTAAQTEVAAEVTAVRFLTLSDAEIAAYVATGEPLDKAGAYAIQGRAARWIPRIEGCYFNVVGLPIALVSTLLESYRSSDSKM